MLQLELNTGTMYAILAILIILAILLLIGYMFLSEERETESS
ncbi:MAG: hypothetical protein ACP6IS_05495 [Candidatus Asgardarchaeia archaeon]